jgi:hypothetical protein
VGDFDYWAAFGKRGRGVSKKVWEVDGERERKERQRSGMRRRRKEGKEGEGRTRSANDGRSAK